MSDSVLRFTVSIAQIKTMADGGLRFAFDAPETAVDIAAALMRVKQAGGVLEIAAVAVIPEPTLPEEKPKNVRLKRNPLYAKETDA